MIYFIKLTDGDLYYGEVKPNDFMQGILRQPSPMSMLNTNAQCEINFCIVALSFYVKSIEILNPTHVYAIHFVQSSG